MSQEVPAFKEVSPEDRLDLSFSPLAKRLESELQKSESLIYIGSAVDINNFEGWDYSEDVYLYAASREPITTIDDYYSFSYGQFIRFPVYTDDQSLPVEISKRPLVYQAAKMVYQEPMGIETRELMLDTVADEDWLKGELEKTSDGKYVKSDTSQMLRTISVGLWPEQTLARYAAGARNIIFLNGMDSESFIEYQKYRPDFGNNYFEYEQLQKILHGENPFQKRSIRDIFLRHH